MSLVDDLIAEAKVARPQRFTPEMVEDLRKLVDHNDRGIGRRFTADDARKILRDVHGLSIGITAFGKGMVEQLGRSWGGK